MSKSPLVRPPLGGNPGPETTYLPTSGWLPCCVVRVAVWSCSPFVLCSLVVCPVVLCLCLVLCCSVLLPCLLCCLCLFAFFSS